MTMAGFEKSLAIRGGAALAVPANRPSARSQTARATTTINAFHREAAPGGFGADVAVIVNFIAAACQLITVRSRSANDAEFNGGRHSHDHPRHGLVEGDAFQPHDLSSRGFRHCRLFGTSPGRGAVGVPGTPLRQPGLCRLDGAMHR